VTGCQIRLKPDPTRTNMTSFGPERLRGRTGRSQSGSGPCAPKDVDVTGLVE
jgi:hypothetical protein